MLKKIYIIAKKVIAWISKMKYYIHDSFFCAPRGPFFLSILPFLILVTSAFANQAYFLTVIIAYNTWDKCTRTHTVRNE